MVFTSGWPWTGEATAFISLWTDIVDHNMID
jgi:hypothetical protein